MKKTQTIHFEDKVFKLVDQYMKRHHVGCSKAVNELLINNNSMCLCVYEDKMQELENKLNKVYSLFSIEALKENVMPESKKEDEPLEKELSNIEDVEINLDGLDDLDASDFFADELED